MYTAINSHEISTPDLSIIDDGTYRGSFGDFLVFVDLEVEVADNIITKILISAAGPGMKRFR